MDKISNIADIIARYSNQDMILHNSAADLGAIILEMKREEHYYGRLTSRMAKLEKMAALQEKVVSRLLERSVDEHDHPKRPHLKIVK